ncbi:MAG TPA: outer membrane protein assembly factor BamA [Candidatus Edwardsbacteria bacterium]|nr:outer membrane protein assembly factor BamA [Candidatus Edwardsbacteria bacterium]
MRIHQAARCCLSLGLLCAAALSASAKPITVLRVQGNERIDEATIINSSMILTGDEFDTTKVAESIRKIYTLGYFSNVTAVSDTAFGGIALTLVVTEKPQIQRVEVVGNKKIKTKDIEEKLPISAESFLDRKAINDAKEYIKSLYQEKGYYNVQVSDTLLESGKRAVVRLTISEGSKQRLAKVRFRGNDHLPAKKIVGAIKSKPRGWTIVWKVIPWWRTGSFNPDTLKEDVGLIKRLYKNYGYIEVAAALDSLSYNAARDRVTANFSVSEGTRYRVGDVTIKGNEKLPSKLLEKMVELKRGQVYRIDDADKSLENLYSAYTEEGYIYCNIFPEEDLRDSSVNVNYGVTENQQAYIRKIIINGNTKTHDKVIRRQLLVRPGDLFRRSAVMRSQREIYSLGYFEDVRINSQKADTNGNIDLIYEVKEKQTGQFQVGVSYGQIDKLVGFTQIGWPNLMGRGQELNLKTEFSKLKFDVQMGFTEPWLFDTPTSAGIDLFHTYTDYEIYDLRRTGGTLRLGRPLPWLDYTRGYWSYTLERDNLSNIEAAYQPYYANQTWPKMSSSTNFTLVRDSRDRPFNATDGTRSVLSAEYAGGLLGGQVKYQKYLAEYRNYHPLFWKFVGMARARVGAVDGYTTPTTVPLDQTFFIGGVGDDGVRGYPDRSLNRGTINRAEAIGNIEIKYSFNPSIYLLTFADAGQSWTSLRKSSLKGFYKGAGVGVRAEIPMLGILGLDWAWGFDRKRLGYSDNWELHFQIGTTF